jgi:hypothetical protein
MEEARPGLSGVGRREGRPLNLPEVKPFAVLEFGCISCI